MFGLRKIWLEAISSVAGRIWRVKQALGQSQSQLKTVFSCFWILALELALAILSLPIYLTRDCAKDPVLFNHDGMAYSTYCRRKKVTLIAAILAVVLTIGYLYLPGQPVKAAVITWDNGGGDGVWGTCTNWSGDACPGTSDIATFDGTSTANVSINAAISVAGIDINSGYTGTITQAAAITVGSSHFDQAAGTFVGASQAIDINGRFFLTAGTYRATSGTTTISDNFNPSGGTFLHNNGGVEFDGSTGRSINVNSSLTLANVTVNITGIGYTQFEDANEYIVVTGTLYLKDGYLDDYAGGTDEYFEVQDCVKFQIDSNFTGSNSKPTAVRITGGTGSVTSTNAQIWPDLVLNAANCTINLSGTGTTVMDHRVNIQAGTFNVNSSTLQVDDTFTQSNGTYNGGSGNSTFTGAFSQSGGIFNGGNVTTTEGGVITFNSTYTLSGGATSLRFSDSADFNGIFSQTGGTFTAPTTTAYFAVNFSPTGGTFEPAGGTIEFDGSAGRSINVNSSLTLANVSVNITGSGYTQFEEANEYIVVTGTLYLKDGFFDLYGSGAVVEAQGDIYQYAAFDGNSRMEGINITGTANQTFYGDATPTGGDLPPITINKTGGTLTFGTGVSTTMRIDAANFTYTAGTVDPASSTWYFVGAMTLDPQGTSVTMSFDDVSFPSGVVTLAGDLDVEGNLTIAGGTLDTNGKNINLYGNWTQSSGQFIHDLATTTFDGVNQTISASTTFYHFQKTSSTRAILTLPVSVTTTFAGNLIWEGAASNLLSVSSSLSGTAANIYPRGTRRLGYLSVGDNNNGSGTIMLADSGTSVKGSNTTNWDFGNDAPTVTISSAAQKKNGTGTVDVAMSFDDANDDDTGSVKMEYKLGSSCSSGTSDPTLDETDANTTATTGDPKTENDNTYQVGNASGYILTSSGANTVNFDWSSKTDVAAANATYCIQLTPYDNTDAGTAVNTTLTLDNVTPTAPGNLTLSSAASTALTLTFGAAGSDTNFDEYLLYYKAGASGVTSYNTQISSTTDANLDSVSYNGAATTQITGLSPNTQYVTNLWIADTYGNSTTAATELAVYTAAAAPASASVSINGLSSATVSWGANSNPAGTEYYAEMSGGATGSSGWITATSYTFTRQFIEGTSYTFTVKARNTSGTETSAVSVGGVTPRSGASAAINFQSRPIISESSGRTLPLMQINNGAASTTQRNVTINFNVRDVAMVALSNYLHFPIRAFVPYRPSIAWELLSEAGQKTVYVKFLALDYQTVSEAQDAIEFLPPPASAARPTVPGPAAPSSTPSSTPPERPVATAPLPAPAPERPVEVEVAIPCAVPVNHAYRADNSRGVFLVTRNCERQEFTTAAVFFSHFSSFTEIRVLRSDRRQAVQPADGVTAADYTYTDLDRIPYTSPRIAPAGPLWTLQNLDLVQPVGQRRVYRLENDQLRWIISEYVFNALNLEWRLIIPIAPEKFAAYPIGENITHADIGPYLRDFSFGQEHEDIKQIGRLLLRLGYAVDRQPTNNFNVTFRDALLRFQQDNGLAQTGQIDRAARAKFNLLHRENRGS